MSGRGDLDNPDEGRAPALYLLTPFSSDLAEVKIDTLEYQLFNSTYEKENIYKRLDRLEKKIFGSTQEGDLASRTDRLKAYVRKDVVAQNPSYHVEQPYSPTKDIEQYMGSQNKYENSDMHIQLSGLETLLFSKTYSVALLLLSA